MTPEQEAGLRRWYDIFKNNCELVEIRLIDPATNKTYSGYFKDINTLTDPQFKWEKVQQLYFKNWLQKTAEYSRNALTIA